MKKILNFPVTLKRVEDLLQTLDTEVLMEIFTSFGSNSSNPNPPKDKDGLVQRILLNIPEDWLRRLASFIQVRVVNIRQKPYVSWTKDGKSVWVDGLLLEHGSCDCDRDLGAHCCSTWSHAKREGNNILFEAKSTSNYTNKDFEWGYEVSKGGRTVSVEVRDTEGNYESYAAQPPSVEEFIERGWRVESIHGKQHNPFFDE